MRRADSDRHLTAIAVRMCLSCCAAADCPRETTNFVFANHRILVIMTDEDLMKEVCGSFSRPGFIKQGSRPDPKEAWSEYMAMQRKSLDSLQALTLHCSATAATLLGLTAFFLPSLSRFPQLHTAILTGTLCLFVSCLFGLLYNVAAFVLHRKSMRVFFQRTIAGKKPIDPSERVRAPWWLTPVAISCPVLMLSGILSSAMTVYVLLT